MTRNTVEGSEGNIGWRVAESNWQGGHLLSLFVFPFEGPLTTNLFKKKPLPPTQAGRTGHSHSSQPSATVLEDDEADVLQAGGGALAEVHPLHAGQQPVDPLHGEVVGPARPRPRSGGHPPPRCVEFQFVTITPKITKGTTSCIYQFCPRLLTWPGDWEALTCPMDPSRGFCQPPSLSKTR